MVDENKAQAIADLMETAIPEGSDPANVMKAAAMIMAHTVAHFEYKNDAAKIAVGFLKCYVKIETGIKL